MLGFTHTLTADGQPCTSICVPQVATFRPGPELAGHRGHGDVQIDLKLLLRIDLLSSCLEKLQESPLCLTGANPFIHGSSL